MAIAPKIQKVTIPFSNLPSTRYVPKLYSELVSEYPDSVIFSLTSDQWKRYWTEDADDITVVLDEKPDSGVIAYETDTGLYKIFDGSHTWQGTKYANGVAYYLRYRIVSEDKNSVSHWSPTLMIKKEKIDTTVIDGGKL